MQSAKILSSAARKTDIVGVCVGVLVLSACAPLQQAPLVYTSGFTVGIKVGVAPTQPDSVEIVVGVKQLDAAYAPVAVARPPQSGVPQDKELFAIKEIYGVFGEDITADAYRRLQPGESDARLC
jgi:hypothetical protein